MIAIDTNMLVYAHRKESQWHEAARRCVRKLAEGRSRWAIPWPCVHEFLSIVTHPRIFRPPTSLSAALDQIDAWLESPTVTLLSESELHWVEMKGLLTSARATGPMVHDARVAALCLQHGVRELWSADRDFGRFPALNVINPMAT